MTNVSSELNQTEKALLLGYARSAVEAVAKHRPLPRPSEDTPSILLENKACFVTLYKDDELRGCTGVLLARQPLINEVIETAASTATSDPRFPPVIPRETASLTIEISVLTTPRQISYSDPAELLNLLRPDVDGVTLLIGRHRGTFLPQVWQKIPEPVDFLGRLCEKMGLPYQAWMSPEVRVEIYQVEELSEHNQP